jgi:hypothetical protein
VAAALDLALLERARAAVNADPAFKRLGTADMAVGLRRGDASFLVTFEAFECAAVEAVDDDRLRDADFELALPAGAWDRYLAERRAGRAPTLLSLDLDTPGGLVRGRDPLRALEFERYQATLQAFIDKSAELAA